MNEPSKCTWHKGTTEKSPHTSQPWAPEPAICDTVLQHIGNTPLVRINKITAEEGVECEVLAKCEFFNAGGSVKDRIGRRMVEDAEKQGRIKPGDTLIEPTSGNTGIGLALAAAIKGYRMIITLPEKMSNEKVDVLKALGAEIVRTPTEAAYDSPESHIGVANRLNKEIPNSHILDQYSNPSNPLAHYEGTAEEIIRQCDGKIDAVVVSAGTGGTIAGIGRKFKEKLPNCKVIGVDPHGSILALPESLNGQISSYQVEGIGYDFIPKVLDRTVVDEWIKSSDKESFQMSRRLIRQEGLLCGGSSGTAMWAAIQVAKRYKKGQRVVVIMPDSVRNYMTKFLSDDWMVEHGFADDEKVDENQMSSEFAKSKVSDLRLQTPLTVLPSVTVKEVVDLMNERNYDQLPVTNEAGEIQGMVTIGNLTSYIASGRIKPSDAVANGLYKKYKEVDLDTSLGRLSRILDRHHYALVTTTQECYSGVSASTKKKVIYGIVTPVDLLNHVNKQ
eukprot:TRINITY_DN66420_c1_g2_i1.p1 TRINITY_DN66420_c1_g2~~TRINITY_DN66420_c1_g2_i1.p1  ORF type:complete len:533 (-),score=290.37 TRINITY_DN66420_c1_g2_i1:961-2466(-)